MLANETHHHNGNGVTATQLYPACPSDYDAVTIDITPMVPTKGNWRDQLAPVTWSMSYIDSSQISHSVTLRGDTEEEVLDMVKPLVAGIRKAKELAKQKASESAPQQATSDPQVPSADVPDVQQCRIHRVNMVRRWSKRTQGHYFGHKLPNGDFCYGRPPKTP